RRRTVAARVWHHHRGRCRGREGDSRMTTPTKALHDLGVSIWLDDLSRQRITSGSLAELIATRDVVGVTTNPTIFAGAISAGEHYAAQVAELAAEDVSVEDAIFRITTDDVRDACDIFLPIYE